MNFSAHSFEAYCSDGVFKYDMAFMMNGQQMAGFESMEITVDATDFPFPDLDASPGTTLPDGKLHISAETGGPVSMNMTVEVSDRKVEEPESIECPAGKFNCVVMSQTTTTRMMVKFETSSKEWYAEGVGVVRSESYNKKGKLQSYALLTAFNPS